MKYTKIIVLFAFSIIAQSCFVAKDYERKVTPAENLYGKSSASTDSTSMADMKWDQLFTDPILQNHIQNGLKNNYDVKIALQNIEAANANFKMGKAGYLPSFNLGADWTHQEISKNSQFGSFLTRTNVNQYQFTGSLSWEADIWGKIRSNKRAANASYLQTVAAQQAINTQIVANIAAIYYQLMAVDAQIIVVDSTLVNRTKSIEIIKALKDAGNVNEVGVKQTEAQLYATQIIKEDLLKAKFLLENTMNILMGQSPQTITRSKLQEFPVTAEIKAGFPALLLSNRPDVMAAEYNLISTFELTNVAKSGFYPALTINGTGGFQSLDLKTWFSANSLFANIVTGLTQPLFNKRQVKTRFEIAKANQEKAYLQFEQSLLNAGKEVSDAMQAYTSESNKLAIRKQQVDALKKAADYSDELLKFGMVNYLEVLTAKDQALNTELNLIDNQYQQYNSIITLYKALGGGWK